MVSSEAERVPKAQPVSPIPFFFTKSQPIGAAASPFDLFTAQLEDEEMREGREGEGMARGGGGMPKAAAPPPVWLPK
jgi:hypothetical protein